MSRPMRCWAPLGMRPDVKTQLVREYDYAFGAVAPLTGEMDSLVLPRCDLEMMKMDFSARSPPKPKRYFAE